MDTLPLTAYPTTDDSPEKPPLCNKNTNTSKTNFCGVDLVRVLAALGVVLLHACVPYLNTPMPGLSWSVVDAPSESLDFLFWGIEVFIMPVFLVLAGFFALGTLIRRGSGALLKNRASRLLVPLGFAIMFVLPFDLYIWVLGWVSDGLVAPVKLKSLKFDNGIDANLWGLSHLWFLQYLFLYVVCAAGLSRIDAGARLVRKVASRPLLAVSALASVAVVTLWVAPQVVWGFQHAFAPVPSKWIYSGVFFAGGMLLAFHDPRLELIQRQWHFGVFLTCLFLPLSVIAGRDHLGTANADLASVFSLAIMTVAAAATTTLAVISLGMKIHSLPQVKYLAAASFWIYIVHHPILGLVHIDLKWLLPDLASELKMLIAFAVTIALSILMYEGFVRSTWLGRKLGMSFEFVKPETKKPLRAFVPETATRKAA